jgi:hypothetical protein
MRESCKYGSVRGARGNSRPYRAGVSPHLLTTGIGRFCCKSPFALIIKIYFGCEKRRWDGEADVTVRL